MQRIQPRPLRLVVKLFPLLGFLSKNLWMLKREHFILPYVEMPVTTRCTLRCEKCANLMQWYDHPEDVAYSDLIRYFDRLTACVDYIEIYTFLGGEPLLYPRLSELLEHAVSCGKIGRVKITTNGTILPSDERLISILSHPKVFVEISDYGPISRQKTQLVSLFNERHIRFRFFAARDNWFDFGGLEPRGRNESTLKRQFTLCSSGCRSYYRGKLHWCPRSGHGMDLGFIPDTPSNYVDFSNTDLSKEELTSQIRALLAAEYVAACNFCDKGTDLFLPVPAAMQMKPYRP